MGSRLVYTKTGRAEFAVIAVPLPELAVGFRFRVLGNELPVAEPTRFTWLGTPTGRPPLQTDPPSRNGVARDARSTPTKWSDAHREEARRLQAEGLSWSEIALRVCGSRDRKSTVQLWLRPPVESTGRKNRPAASLSGSP